MADFSKNSFGEVVEATPELRELQIKEKKVECTKLGSCLFQNLWQGKEMKQGVSQNECITALKGTSCNNSQ